MASTTAGRQATDTHRARMTKVRASTLRELARLWPSWSVEDSGSFAPFVRSAAAVTYTGHQAAVQETLRYWTVFAAAEIGDPLVGVPAATLDLEDLVGWLRRSGLGGTVRALRSGKPMVQARQVGLVELSGAAAQTVGQADQQTVLNSVDAERKVRGWARTTSGNPCAFCAMLAGRGPVYKTQSSASFQTHKSCACGAEPVYRTDGDWPGKAGQFKDQYDTAITEARAAGELQRGTSNDLLNAFRRHFQP